MTDRSRLLAGCAVLLALGLAAPVARTHTRAFGQERRADRTTAGHDYPIQPVPFTAVHLNDVFWAPRIETNRKVTIPFAFQQCEISGRVDNFERAAKALRGELENQKQPGYPFDDSDLYKVIEGASYVLSVHPDPKLDAYVDGLIAKIAAAQEPDGYLYTARTINPRNPHRWSGTERWELERDDSHELYNLGHLYEAAVAHYQATGKRSLLDIAIKSANLLIETFGPDKRSIWPGHQITEMGLAKLYRVTGNERYLTLAKFLLDERGPDSGGKTNPRGLTYNQAQQKVTEQIEAVGHAVRATYMYSGMADVAAMTGDASYVKAVDAIWHDVVSKKLYITGGIGARGSGEAFGGPYELPNMTAYNETCAAVGNDFWNERMFLLHGDARYVDVLERTLYNGLISGVSLDGKSFFYPNPLESKGQHQRSPWFGVACCPGNITRFLASVPGYVYARQGETLFVNLFAAGTADTDLGGRALTIAQETRYPWDGTVRIKLSPDRAGDFTVKVRIPGWARHEPVPGDLYRFLDSDNESEADGRTGAIRLVINGTPAPAALNALDRGYATLTRRWRPGDTIELTLPMPVRRVIASERVEADRDRIALQRGPIVYAAEWPDSASGHVRNLVLPDNAPLRSEFRPDLLGGIQVVTGKAYGLSVDAHGTLVKTDQTLVAIPYSTWANRGRGEMLVWIARADAAARPTPAPTVATTSRVAASGKKDPRAVNDGDEPVASNDSSFYFDWWPVKGTTEWIEYTFPKVETVSEAQVYWFDDTGRGQVRVPRAWRILYKDGDQWKPVDAHGPYPIGKDRYDTVSFTPVTAAGLRLEVTMQPEWSAGVQRWKVR